MFGLELMKDEPALNHVRRNTLNLFWDLLFRGHVALLTHVDPDRGLRGGLSIYYFGADVDPGDARQLQKVWFYLSPNSLNVFLALHRGTPLPLLHHRSGTHV